MILLADVIVRQIQVCLFSNLNTGMPKDFTEGENIHAIHQTSFGKIISQAVGCVFFIQSSTQNVLFEITFEIAYTDGTAVFLDGEEVVALHISVLKL